MSSSLDISFDTSEILDIAEKLVDDAEKKIFQVSHDIKNFQLDDDSYADESGLYIRDIVNNKFKELNQGILPLENNYFSDENQEYQDCNCDQQKDEPRKSPKVLALENNYSQVIADKEAKNHSTRKPQPKIRIKIGTFNKTDSIKTQSSQLSLISSLKVDLMQNDKRKNNFTIPDLKSDSSERKQKKKSSVDTAVQTSIQEIPHDKPDPLDKSPELLPEKNIYNDEIKPGTITASNSKQPDLKESHLQSRDFNEENKKPKESFIEFICRIAELEAHNLSDINCDDLIEKNKNNLSHNKTGEVEIIDEDFDFDEVNIYSPKFDHVDKILNNFDGKIKSFVENSNKLANIFSRISFYNNNINNIQSKITKADKKDNNFDEKLSFKPQYRNLSSDLTITSESLKPPERFSTPLNNYSANIEVKNACNDTEELPAPAKFDINNDSKVFITRNKFSPSAGCEKNEESSKKIIDKTEDESMSNFFSSETLESSQKQISEKNSEELYNFSHISTDKKSDSKEETEMKSQKLSDTKKELKSKKSSLSNEKNQSKSVKLQESSKNNQSQLNNKNVEPDNLEINLIVDSSKDDLRDRTSFDVSAIYSESFETASFSENEIASDEGKKANENSKLNNEEVKFEPVLLSIDKEKNNINEKPKGESQVSEKIKSISVGKNVEDEKSINRLTNSNPSASSSTKNNNREHTSSLYLGSYQQSRENSSSVEILQDKTEKSSSDDYSEGELHQPISLGEVTVTGAPKSQENKNSNYYQNLTDYIHDILNSSLQSLGEILNSNEESTPSLTLNVTHSYD